MEKENLNKLEEIRALTAKTEQTAIGYMLQDEQAAINATKILHEKYFMTPEAAHVFRLVKSYIGEGKSVSDIFFKTHWISEEDWKALPNFSGISREEYLRQCKMLAIPFLCISIAAEGVFSQIWDQYLRRELLDIFEKATLKIQNTASDKNVAEVIIDSCRRSNSLLEGVIKNEEHNYEVEIMNVLNAKERPVISTGYKLLDDFIDGFRPGQLITIGAGTGVGKSAFAVNLALNITKQGYKVGLWSFEMDKEEVYQRIISNITGISRNDESRAEERYNGVRKYLEETKDNIQIFTDRIKDLGNFYLQCRRGSIKENMKVVIIDYVQLMHLSGFSGSNRVTEIELITKTLKNMASELGITIIILSQLSREYQKRDNKQPILSDLRDSGSIEQDSNIVIFLHRQEDYPLSLNESEKFITVIVAKNRDGRSGLFVLKYQGDITKFKE
jgi:replicative DNA helicase